MQVTVRRASREVVDETIREGAAQRVRSKAMTVAVILAGLVPIVWGNGTSSEVISRIAVPMLRGMVTALLSLFVVPAAALTSVLRRPAGHARRRHARDRTAPGAGHRHFDAPR